MMSTAIVTLGSFLAMSLASAAEDHQHRSAAHSCADVVKLRISRWGDLLAGARVITEEEFRAEIIQRSFTYKSTEDDLTITAPKETYFADGKYLINGTRFDSSGTYSFSDGVVTVSTSRQFLGLGNSRAILKSKKDRMFIMSCVANGTMYEMVKNS